MAGVGSCDEDTLVLKYINAFVSGNDVKIGDILQVEVDIRSRHPDDNTTLEEVMHSAMRIETNLRLRNNVMSRVKEVTHGPALSSRQDDKIRFKGKCLRCKIKILKILFRNL